VGLHTQGQVLREVERQTQKSCDTDKGGCGRDQQVLAFLEGTPPAAFTLQLAWESHAESSADIRDTMATIQEVCRTFFPFYVYRTHNIVRTIMVGQKTWLSLKEESQRVTDRYGSG